MHARVYCAEGYDRVQSDVNDMHENLMKLRDLDMGIAAYFVNIVGGLSVTSVKLLRYCFSLTIT